MYRNAEAYLYQWLKSKNRKPLVIRGARQVGKSTLVKNFAKSQGFQLIEVNLEKTRLKSLQKDQINIQNIISEIETSYNITFSTKTLIFLDEIQKQPILIAALRYFYEEYAHIPLISAGSLLEFELEKHEFQMPVGRIQYYHLGPMSFFEFLIARKKDKLIELIEKNKYFLDEPQFDQLTSLLQEYLFVGGMPEAIQIFIDSKNPNLVRDVHRSIVQTYRDDFPKYARHHQLENLQNIFDKVPQFIGKKNKYTDYSQEVKSREIKKCLYLLTLARVILPCYHSNGSGLPLLSQKDENVFKNYFLDIGLLNYLRGVTWQQMQEYNHSSLLTKGEIAEQFAAQHLAYKDNGLEPPQLFYWLRDKTSGKAEIDFLTEIDGKVVPVEIKAGRSGKLKSLIQFFHEKQITKAIRFDLGYRQKILEIFQAQSSFGRKEKIKLTLLSYHLGLVEKIVT